MIACSCGLEGRASDRQCHMHACGKESAGGWSSVKRVWGGWQGWEELMLVVESAMAGARKEVALAAIGVITTVTTHTDVTFPATKGSVNA